MRTTIQWDIAAISVDSSDEAATFIDEQSEKVNNWGTRGFTLFFGPVGTDWADLPLRIDFDPDVGAAAIRWLPDGLVADCGHKGQTLHVLEDSGDPLVEVPGTLVRASIDTAKIVAAEYVDTGQRPASVIWEPVK